MERTVAYVAVENTAYSFDMLYTYLVPEKLEGTVRPGSRVMIKFGTAKKERQGIVFSLGTAEESKKLKEIIAVPDKAPLLNNEALEIARWLHEKTFCTYFEGARVQLPTGVNLKVQISYIYLSARENEANSLGETEGKIYSFLKQRNEYVSREEILSLFSLSENSKILDEMAANGFIFRNFDTIRKVGDATAKMVRLRVCEEEIDASDERFTPKQTSVINLLKDVGSASVKEVCYFTGTTTAVVKTLTTRGILEVFDIETYRTPEVRMEARSADGEIILTDEQQQAFDNLMDKYRKGGGCSLLFGVTGSGKTSVYIKLIDEVIKENKGVIVMVPEISLTPSLMALFKGRYGNKVAAFHSGLSVGERYDEWKRVRNGDAIIAVGTRSAVFAPFESLGLIIMDEEQEHTYKSEQNPKFHARDVAKFRANYNKSLLVLASATPSLETYTFAKSGRYSLEKLTRRYGKANLPQVTVVNMRQERKNGNRYSISSPLLEQLEKNLKEGYQSILLINRRGYNTFAACDECGHVRVCPSCSVSLSYHKDNGRLMCHYCGYSEIMEKECPECHKPAVRFSGSGTQKTEDELKELLPEARVVRMDTDSTLSRYAHEDKLSAFARGEYDILLGTQMVAKGLDFEKVTLVGVLMADQELNGDDFMSSERAFDLLTQVVGRAGRGDTKGRAIIQTINPDSSVIHMAQRQDYEAFYDNEIYIRKFMVYPPYCDICAVNFSSETEYEALASARCFLFGIQEATKEVYKDVKVMVLGPMPPKIAKMNGKYRYRIIIKCRNTKEFRLMMKDLLLRFSKNKEFKKISVSIDINPESLA